MEVYEVEIMEKISISRAKIIADKQGIYPAIAGTSFFYFVSNKTNPNVVDWDEFTEKFNASKRSVYMNEYTLKRGKDKGKKRYYLQVR